MTRGMKVTQHAVSCFCFAWFSLYFEDFRFSSSKWSRPFLWINARYWQETFPSYYYDSTFHLLNFIFLLVDLDSLQFLKDEQPNPGLRSRVEGGKEVVGNRDGDRGGSRRSWRARTGLCLFQPRLHVSGSFYSVVFIEAYNLKLCYHSFTHGSCLVPSSAAFLCGL